MNSQIKKPDKIKTIVKLIFRKKSAFSPYLECNKQKFDCRNSHNYKTKNFRKCM